MRLYKLLSRSLGKFKVKSLTKPIGFYWSGRTLSMYQGGSAFTMNNIASCCFMPRKVVRGLILPSQIRTYLDAHYYIEDNKEDVAIVPVKWGFDIYNVSAKNTSPQLVHEVRFYSIKGKLPLLLARVYPEFRIALKNAKGPLEMT